MWLTPSPNSRIRAPNRRQIYLLDAEQTVRPADLPQSILQSLVEAARSTHRRYPLTTQMRVRAGTDYVQFVRDVLRGESDATERPDFGDYDLRLFDNLAAMQRAILDRDAERGLARLIASYAWDWTIDRDKEAFDIELDGVRLRWNSQAKDWINSPGSIHEVGSIHTVQDYDLNCAGVIIGHDLRYDPYSRRLFIDRGSYRDAKAKRTTSNAALLTPTTTCSSSSATSMGCC